MKEIEIAVIVNSFNRLSLLKKSLTSLISQLNQTGIAYAVVIFDANSTDGSIEWINDFIDNNKEEQIYLLLASGNEPDSFSYGVNKASEYAFTKFSTLKYLLLYETDNYLASHIPIVQSRKILLENDLLAACGYTVKKYDGSNAGFGSSFPSIISFILGQQLSFYLKLNKPILKWEQTKYVEISYAEVVYTSPLLIKKDAWSKLNGFDYLNFPFSDCDIDLAYRIKLIGQKMAVIKTDQVLHDNLAHTSSWSATRTLSFYRARYAYFRKHTGSIVSLLKPLLFLMHLTEYSILLMLRILGKKKSDSLKVRRTLLKSVFFNYEA